MRIKPYLEFINWYSVKNDWSSFVWFSIGAFTQVNGVSFTYCELDDVMGSEEIAHHLSIGFLGVCVLIGVRINAE